MTAFIRLRHFAAGLLLGAALLTAGCQSTPSKVPATITTTLTKNHRAIPGTHVLLSAPADFKLEADERILRREGGNMVKVLELQHVRFEDYVKQVQQEVDSLEKKLPADALQKTTFNGRPAIFLTQPHSQWPDREVALLAFGDTNRVVVLVGMYPRILLGARKSVQQIMLTACYDPKLPVAGDNVDIQLDLAGTGYQQVGQVERWKLYRPTAEPITDSIHTTLLRVMLLPPLTERSHVQDVALSLIRNYRTEAEVLNVQENNTMLNGNYAYQNVVSYRHDGKLGQALVMLVSTPQGLIVLDGRAYEKPYAHVLQFWELAKKIRIGAPLS